MTGPPTLAEVLAAHRAITSELYPAKCCCGFDYIADFPAGERIPWTRSFMERM